MYRYGRVRLVPLPCEQGEGLSNVHVVEDVVADPDRVEAYRFGRLDVGFDVVRPGGFDGGIRRPTLTLGIWDSFLDSLVAGVRWFGAAQRVRLASLTLRCPFRQTQMLRAHPSDSLAGGWRLPAPPLGRFRSLSRSCVLHALSDVPRAVPEQPPTGKRPSRLPASRLRQALPNTVCTSPAVPSRRGEG